MWLAPLPPSFKQITMAFPFDLANILSHCLILVPPSWLPRFHVDSYRHCLYCYFQKLAFVTLPLINQRWDVNYISNIAKVNCTVFHSFMRYERGDFLRPPGGFLRPKEGEQKVVLKMYMSLVPDVLAKSLNVISLLDKIKCVRMSCDHLNTIIIRVNCTVYLFCIFSPAVKFIFYKNVSVRTTGCYYLIYSLITKPLPKKKKTIKLCDYLHGVFTSLTVKLFLLLSDRCSRIVTPIIQIRSFSIRQQSPMRKWMKKDPCSGVGSWNAFKIFSWE